MNKPKSLTTKKLFSLLVAFVFLFISCTPYKNVATLTPVQDPVTTEDLIYSHSSDLIRVTDNHLKTAWANRKNVQVLNVDIINISEKPIHGSQFSFYSNGNRLEIVNNKLAAEKLKTKRFPAIVYIIPVVLVGVIIYAAITPVNDMDGDGFSDVNNDSSKKKKKDPMKGANLIQKKLYNFNIASTIIQPGERINRILF